MSASGDAPVFSTDCYNATHAQLWLRFVQGCCRWHCQKQTWQHAAGPGGKAQPFPLRSSFPSAEEAVLLGALSAQDPLCILLPSHSGHTAGPKLRACNMPFTSDIICGKFNFLQGHDRNKITLLFVALGWILSSICFLCIRSLLNWCQWFSKAQSCEQPQE